MAFGDPPLHWYDPPEPVLCCSLAEDDPEHDSEACLAESAEADAERRAEIARERLEDSNWYKR